MRIAVLGAHGQMGLAVARLARERGLLTRALAHDECDITNHAALQTALRDLRPGDAVINAAAKLGTGEAEISPCDQFETNVRGAMLVALEARTRQAAVVHFSTDYVFDGTKATAYVESDPPNPLNMYGALKLASELVVRQANPAHYVLRIASVFGRAKSSSKGPNFVDRMLQAAANAEKIEVDDRLVMSPTYAADAARITLDLLERRAEFGTYHGANAGGCTWLEFTNAIFELCGHEKRAVARNPGADPIERPRNSVLASNRLQHMGLASRSWREALAAYLLAAYLKDKGVGGPAGTA